MINIKTCLLFLLFICLAASLDKSFERRVAALRNLLESDNDDLQESDADRRHNQYQTDRSENSIKSNRRDFLKYVKDEQDENKIEEDLGLRALLNSRKNDEGIVITLQNRAVMNTRLRALYTDSLCQPYLVESDTLWTHQTKSVSLPLTARNIKVVVQKDIVFGNWRDAYTFSMNTTKVCLRITGVTLSSKIQPCE